MCHPSCSGERDGINYHFLTEEEFTKLENQNALKESGTYKNFHYGALKPSASSFTAIYDDAATARSEEGKNVDLRLCDRTRDAAPEVGVPLGEFRPLPPSIPCAAESDPTENPDDVEDAEFCACSAGRPVRLRPLPPSPPARPPPCPNPDTAADSVAISKFAPRRSCCSVVT